MTFTFTTTAAAAAATAAVATTNKCSCVVVMRVQGSLRVVLNTLIWSDMLVERSSRKSVRVSAIDSTDDGIKIYLIQATTTNCCFPGPMTLFP